MQRLSRKFQISTSYHLCCVLSPLAASLLRAHFSLYNNEFLLQFPTVLRTIIKITVHFTRFETNEIRVLASVLCLHSNCVECRIKTRRNILGLFTTGKVPHSRSTRSYKVKTDWRFIGSLMLYFCVCKEELRRIILASSVSSVRTRTGKEN